MESKWNIPEAPEPKDLGLVPFPGNSLSTPLGFRFLSYRTKTLTPLPRAEGTVRRGKVFHT